MDRRDFLKKFGASAATVAAVATSCKLTGKSPVGKSESVEPSGEMTYRTAGHGDKVSILGYGCMRWPTIEDENGNKTIDQEEVNHLVDYALEHGINYFDTAPTYIKGQSEPCTGIALKRHPRESYFIATKLSNSRGNHSREEAMTMYRKSFENLQTDYIDYYLLHTIGSGKNGMTGPELVRKRFFDNGMVDFLLKEREAGRIRNLGFSVHCDDETFDYMMSLHEQYHWDFVQIQMNYVDWDHADGESKASYMYQELAKRNIPVIVMEPLLGGRLANIPEYSAKRLQTIEPQKSMASWAFRFCGTWPGVATVLSGMTYMEHLQDNLKTFSPLKPLTEEEFGLLAEIGDDFASFPLIDCNYCDYCMPCPYGLDIPGIFRHYNKCVNEGMISDDAADPDYKKARRAFLLGYDRSVPKLRQAEMCISCRKCEDACPQHVKIHREMKKIDKYVEVLRDSKL